MSTSRRSPLVLLFLAVFNSILGLSLLFPILAPLGRSLGLGELEIGSLTGGYALMQLVMSPVWGRRSERVGRKPVILIGIVGFAAAFYAFALAAEAGLRGYLPHGALYAALLAARLLGGALSSATLPTAQAYVADVTERADRTSGMAMIGAAFGLAVIFGPALGALLSTLSLLAPVYASATLAVANALFVRAILPEPEGRAAPRAGVRLSWRDGRVLPLLVVGLGATLASVAMEQTVAFYFQDQLDLSTAMTPRYVGAALVVYGVVAVLMQGVVIRRYRVTPRTLLRVGPPLALAGFVALLVSSRFAMLTGALALQGLGQGLIVPGVTSALSLSVGDDEQGPVAGMNSASQALARMLGPLVGGGLYEIDRRYPYVFAALLLALLIVVSELHRRRGISRPPRTAAG